MKKYPSLIPQKWIYFPSSKPCIYIYTDTIYTSRELTYPPLKVPGSRWCSSSIAGGSDPKDWSSLPILPEPLWAAAKTKIFSCPVLTEVELFRAGLGLGDSVGDDLGGWWDDLGGWWVILFGSWKLEVKGFTAQNVMILLRNFPEWSFVLLGIWRRTPNLDDFNYIQQALWKQPLVVFILGPFLGRKHLLRWFSLVVIFQPH